MTVTKFLYSHLCQLFWPKWCRTRKCKHSSPVFFAQYIMTYNIEIVLRP